MSVGFQERYAQAIRSANLACDPQTSFSDLDVIGAMAWADKRLADESNKRTRLGAGAVSRVLAGDDRSVLAAVEALSARLLEQYPELRPILARDIAKACLAWLVHGRCRACLRHDQQQRLSCARCDGTGRILFGSAFPVQHRDMAKWLVREIASDLAISSTEALVAIAPKV